MKPGDKFKFFDCTPRQVRNLGFKFPGDVEEEEIEEIDTTISEKSLGQKIAEFRLKLKSGIEKRDKKIWDGKNTEIYTKLENGRYICLGRTDLKGRVIEYDMLIPFIRIIKINEQ